MKQRKYKSLRACSLVLLIALGMTMLCGADRVEPTPAGEVATGNAAQTKTAEVTAATNTPMSYEEYFSQRREFEDKEGTHKFTFEETTIYPCWENPQEDEFTFSTTIKRDGKLISRYPYQHLSTLVDGDIILEYGGRVLRLSESGLSTLCKVPEGQVITKVKGDGENVLFLWTETTDPIPKEYIYRYYIPENKMELLLDFDAAGIIDLKNEHNGSFTVWTVWNNEDMTIRIHSMKGVDITSDEYGAYLEQQIKKHEGNTDVQEYLQYILETDRFCGVPYSFDIAYNSRTKEMQILNTRSEYDRYQIEYIGFQQEV